MKKVEVLFDFYDKFHTSTRFKAGDVVEFEDERAADVVARGLAKLVKTKGKTEKSPVQGEDGTSDGTKDGGNANAGEDNTNTGEDDTKSGEDVKPAGEITDDEKKKASEKKAAEILAKVNKK